MNVAFYIAAGVAIISTALVISRRNAIHALLYLIVSLLSVAVVFFLLGAPFIAALEVIIYAGAIMVLFIFVVMMLNLGRAAVERERAWLSLRMWIGPSILASIMLVEMIVIFHRGMPLTTGGGQVEPKEVGLALFGPYAIAVELASLLLLSAMVGAYHLGRRERNRFDGHGRDSA